MVFLDGGIGFLFQRTLIFSVEGTTDGPPSVDCIESLSCWIVVVAGLRDVRVKDRAGLRVDFKTMVMLGTAASDPGGASVPSSVVGGKG